jgi:hypothetical protein
MRHLLLAVLILMAAPLAAQTPNPCTYLTTDQIAAATGLPSNPGTPGPKNCVWHATKSNSNVYLTLRDGATYDAFKAQVQAAGHMTPVTGLGDDAFFLGGSPTSSALYVRKGAQVILLIVRIDGASLDKNQAAEKTLAAQILPHL